MIEILTLTPDHPRYVEIIAHFAAEPLATQWWSDAESRHEPGVSYALVLADDVPAAWAGWIVTEIDGIWTLKCCSNYERRGAGRERGLYALAYNHRHRATVAPSALAAVTYLFPEPIELHEADGWTRTGLADLSDDGHDWAELRREPTASAT